MSADNEQLGWLLAFLLVVPTALVVLLGHYTHTYKDEAQPCTDSGENAGQ